MYNEGESELRIKNKTGDSEVREWKEQKGRDKESKEEVKRDPRVIIILLHSLKIAHSQLSYEVRRTLP